MFHMLRLQMLNSESQIMYEGWLKSFKTDFFIQNQMTLQALQFFLFQSSVLHSEYIFYSIL